MFSTCHPMFVLHTNSRGDYFPHSPPGGTLNRGRRQRRGPLLRVAFKQLCFLKRSTVSTPHTRKAFHRRSKAALKAQEVFLFPKVVPARTGCPGTPSRDRALPSTTRVPAQSTPKVHGAGGTALPRHPPFCWDYTQL